MEHQGVFRLSGTVRIAGDAESGVLLDIRSGRYYRLTPTARDICTTIALGATFEATLDAIEQRYTADREQIRREVEQFLNTLVQLGFCNLEEGDTTRQTESSLQPRPKSKGVLMRMVRRIGLL